MRTRHMSRAIPSSSLPVLAVLLALMALPALAAGLPKEGDTLPGFTMPAPTAKDCEYLGIPKAKPFGLKDIKAKLVVFEVIGVYCPQCHDQAPRFNDLYRRLKKAKLDDRVKILALAAGGYPAEVDYLRSQGAYTFPVVTDQDFSVHKTLGEPKTPFTLIVDSSGKVLWAHLGIEQNIDAVFKRLSDLAQ